MYKDEPHLGFNTRHLIAITAHATTHITPLTHPLSHPLPVVIIEDKKARLSSVREKPNFATHTLARTLSRSWW